MPAVKAVSWGVDLSHHHSTVDAHKAGSKFLFTKLTERTSFLDGKHAMFWGQAKKHALPFGVYHFARGGSIAEADWFLHHAKPYLGKAVLILDWEDAPTLHNVSAAKRWLDYVKNKTGQTPWIYMSRSTANAYDWSAVAKHYPLWVARYNPTLGTLKHWPRPVMWQYTDSHATQGDRIDANHAYITPAQMRWYYNH